MSKANGGFVNKPVPFMVDGHMDPIGLIVKARCRRCDRRLEDDQMAITWPELYELCRHKAGQMEYDHKIGPIKKPCCSIGERIRCCRLMCPLWKAEYKKEEFAMAATIVDGKRI